MNEPRADFEQRAVYTDPIWRHAMSMVKLGEWLREDALYWVAHSKTIELNEAREKIWKLEEIAPKKIRTPDGKEHVWHCPNDLIPLDETLQYR